MPAVDPLSASARPFVTHEFVSLDRASRTTLQKLDQNATVTRSSSGEVNSKTRIYKDSLPSPSQNIPPYTHWRTASSTSLQDFEQINLHTNPRSSVVDVGSDQWMDDEVSRCLVAAKADLDIK